LQLGGVVGNLIDRLAVGHVTDFISIRGLPVMNLADIALYVGLLILAASVLLRPEKKANQAEPASPDQP
jgi:signal peptidase II